MKHIVMIAALMVIACAGYSQTFPARTSTGQGAQGMNRNINTTGGAIASYFELGGTPMTIVSGTVTPTTAPDTLNAPPSAYTGYKTDTIYHWFNVYNRYDKRFDLTVTQLTGTLTGTAVLQGSRDGKKWSNITGATSSCASCVGASATLTGAGSSVYTWMVPEGVVFPQYQIAAYGTGTFTATSSATMGGEH